MQTSGNCVRNITTDQWAGVAPDEIEDPRIWAEILRQHSTLHPEFSFLPRKFKIAVTAADARPRRDRVCTTSALRLHRNGAGEVGFEVMVGGGLGRTPFLGKTIKPFLHKRDLLSYVEAILRVYNQYGRRDNIYKARIKILVHELGAEKFAEEVEAEWQAIKDGALALDPAVDRRHRGALPLSGLRAARPTAGRAGCRRARRRGASTPGSDNSVANHKVPGYSIVTLSLKPEGRPPGDATAEQMDAIADLADRYSFGEIRVGHEQNLVLPHVRAARSACALARARCDRRRHAECRARLRHHRLSRVSIIAVSPMRARSRWRRRLSRRFRDLDVARDLGRLHINISGCINACGHHHVGHIGILGVEKNGEEFYQITLGGRADEQAAARRAARPAVPYDEVADVIEDIVAAYLELRERPDEIFIDTVKRIGVEPFKERVYATR